MDYVFQALVFHKKLTARHLIMEIIVRILCNICYIHLNLLHYIEYATWVIYFWQWDYNGLNFFHQLEWENAESFGMFKNKHLYEYI